MSRLLRALISLCCRHQWARRVAGRRVYLECVRCLTTTRGVES